MTRRNFILLIIILVIITTIVFGYLYFYQPGSTSNGGTSTNFLSQFNPFGSSKTQNPPNKPNESESETPSTEPEVEIPTINLRKVSSMAIAGYGVFKKERFKDVPAVTPSTMMPELESGVATTTVSTTPTPPPTEFITALRYVARATGNIYQTFADITDERKFSNTMIPRVHEAYFGNKAESVIMRYLGANEITIETFVGNIPKEVLGADTTGENEIKGSFLPQNIVDISVAGDGSTILYLAEVGGSVVGTTHNLLDNKKVQIFDSPFTEWLSSWPNNKMITLTTKPSGAVPGYMYSIDPSVKKLNKVLGGINGLTTLASPDAKLIIYSGNDLSLSLYDISTKLSNPLGVITLPEKCVWGKTSTIIYCAVPEFIDTAVYPDAWYKGELSFTDRIWKIDILSGETEIIADPILTAGESIDGIKLGLDEDENYLFLVNKKDSYLWELGLK